MRVRPREELATKPRFEKYSGPPMTLGNMRQSGVSTLAVYCDRCHHDAVLDVSGYSDDVTVPAFGPRMVCTVCGTVGADARPNWNERAPVSLFGPSC